MKHFTECIRRVLISFLVILFLPILSGVSYAEDEGVITIPGNLRIIDNSAFFGDCSIHKVVLQEGVVSIRYHAFADSSLREINLPASLKYISENAFDNTNLTTVTAVKGTYAYTWAREHGYITEYRALLIGETKFLRNNKLDYTNRNANDVSKMTAMLGRVYGPTGEKFQVTSKINADRNTIQKMIQATFAGTMDHDVSLFFIATHGNSDTGGDGDLEMPFNGDPDDYDYYNLYASKRYLPFSMLAEWLSTMVNGKVVVILESCGAGSSIYEANGAKRGAKTEDELSEEFVQAAMKAFSKADPGIETVATEMNPDLNRKSTGDLRQPKFYVLAAAAHQEESYGYSNTSSDPVNLFTKWLIQGVGEAGNSPADINPQDSILMLDELHQYIKKVGDNYRIKIQIGYDDNGKPKYKYVYQHVQVYPENSNQAIFLLK